MMTHSTAQPYINTAITSVGGFHKMKKGEQELALDNDKHGQERFKLGVWPGKDVLATHAGIHRSISSAITDAQIGKIGPHAHPSTINKADSRYELAKV
jgi:hypothetical protein